MKFWVFVGTVLLIAAGFFFPNRSAQTTWPPGLLTPDERQTITAKLIDRLNRTSPRAAMLELRSLANENGRILRSCHPFTHELGHAAYVKFQDFGKAMAERDEFCNAGFIHGVIEAHFSNGYDQATLLATCQDHGTGQVQDWECFHGVGHGLMFYSDNNLPWALDECEKLSTQFGRDTCRNGVWMENFSADDLSHRSAWRRVDDPLWPCAEQRIERQTDCYLYAPAYFLGLQPNQSQTMLQLCAAIPSIHRFTCSSGVGTEMGKQHLDRLHLAAEACQRGMRWQRQPCFEGILSYVYFHHGGDLSASRQDCRQFGLVERMMCYYSFRS